MVELSNKNCPYCSCEIEEKYIKTLDIEVFISYIVDRILLTCITVLEIMKIYLLNYTTEIYFCVLKTNEGIETRKILKLN